MNLYVAYYRVSTEEQGESGLGLAAQEESVRKFIDGNGLLTGSFQDIESGTSESRQGIEDAINLCHATGATLVVKELSRITRGGYKYESLMYQLGVQYIESSSPHDSQLVKDIKISVSKDERSKISDRTKGALAQIKKAIRENGSYTTKGGKVIKSLGKPENLTEAARDKSIQVRQRKAYQNTNNTQAGAYIKALVKSGVKTFKEMTNKLNESGFKTSRGNKFSEVQTKRLYLRYC